MDNLTTVVDFLQAGQAAGTLNPFKASILAQYDKKGTLSEKQVACIMRDVAKATKTAPDGSPPEADDNSAPAQVTVTQPGVYETPEGEVFIVKPNREKTRLYAKRLVEIGGTRLTEAGEVVNIDFEYAPGVIFKLTPDMKMPLEKAKALTVRYGRCIVCGRHLKAAKSVEQGIGPVCIKYFAPEPVPHVEDEDPNVDWANWKNEFAQVEQQQENAAYAAKLERDAELFGVPEIAQCD